MPERKYKWYKIADTTAGVQFGENGIALIEITGKKICVVQTPEGLAACTAKCPHAGGNMAEGFLNKDGNIVCPVHRYVFNLVNGRDVTGEGYFLKIYPLKADEMGIYVGIEEGGLFGWLK